MYVRIFSEILNSSLMDSSIESRWLFVTMLILGDEARDGVIDMPVTRLAAHAGMTVEQTRRGLAELMEPDTNSSSKDHGGRRVIYLNPETPDRGWVVVNWLKYKQIAREEARKAQARKDSASYRERLRAINEARQVPSGLREVAVRSKSGTTESETESYPDTDKEKTGGPGKLPVPVALLTLWNENRGPFPKALKLTKAREVHARARLTEEPDLEVWKTAITRATRSAFCRGEVGERGWVADFDWLLRPDTLTKIQEGKFDDTKKAAPRGNVLRNAEAENLERRWNENEAQQAEMERRAPRAYPGPKWMG